jgi:hypothetical protein
MNYGFLVGIIGFSVVVGLFTNKVMDYTMNEGFTMDPSSKFKALLNMIEFDNEQGGTVLRTTVPLVVENKVCVKSENKNSEIELKPKSGNSYFKLIPRDRGTIGELLHVSNAGSENMMPMFGVDEYKGPMLVNVATIEKGASVKVSGTWPPYRGWEFKPEYLLSENLSTWHHSLTDKSPWNEVILAKKYPIYRISITNINSQHSYRLNKPIIELYDGGNVVHKVQVPVKGAINYFIDFDGINADRVRITNPDDFLHIPNLKIFTKE